eukprot:g3529.t1
MGDYQQMGDAPAGPLPPPFALSKLDSDKEGLLKGLTDAEVAELVKKYGLNEVPEEKEPLWKMFLKQFTGPMQIMIECAALLCFLIHNWPDFTIIMGQGVLGHDGLPFSMNGIAPGRIPDPMAFPSGLGTRPSLLRLAMAIAEDRIRMECDKCGYKCVPQWLNDRAHCLKCQAVLRSRGSVHEAKREIFGAEANGETRRSCGEASTFKAPDGVHHWKYGKCNFCQVPEGKLAKGPGVMANPGGAAECEKGGKCMFKFAKCTKCGRGECGMAGPDSRRSSTTSTASSENAARVVPVTKPRPQSPTLAAAALVVKETKSEEEEVSQKTSKEDLG